MNVTTDDGEPTCVGSDYRCDLDNDCTAYCTKIHDPAHSSWTPKCVPGVVHDPRAISTCCCIPPQPFLSK